MQIDLSDYFNKTLEEAINKAKENELIYRITKQDGNRFLVTMDIKFNRLNFTVENNIVTDCKVG
jgi:hypothetical protein